MMWFIDKLISLLTFPINWFWESFEKYKETKSIGKIILLFAGSLSGLALIGGSLAWLVFYLINYHIEWVVISGVIIWLYAYVKSKLDKKKAENVVADVPTIDPVVAELLMLGRGIGYGVWIVTQRADASLFVNGARDNFMIVLGLGRMSKEQKGMIFAGEELPDKIYHQGEGSLLADNGHPLYEVAYPRICNIVDWKLHIYMEIREVERQGALWRNMVMRMCFV